MLERILGLDVGTKRIGVAISDPLMIIAQPLITINRQPEAASINELKNICNEHSVTKMVLGLPKNMNNTIGPQAEDVIGYADLIKENLNLEIFFEDERLTSKVAEQILISQNKKPFKNKGLIDVTSAGLILQQYLDKRRV